MPAFTDRVFCGSIFLIQEKNERSDCETWLKGNTAQPIFPLKHLRGNYRGSGPEILQNSKETHHNWQDLYHFEIVKLP